MKIQRIMSRGEDGPEYYLVYIRASFCTSSLPLCFEVGPRETHCPARFISFQTYARYHYRNVCVNVSRRNLVM